MTNEGMQYSLTLLSVLFFFFSFREALVKGDRKDIREIVENKYYNFKLYSISELLLSQGLLVLLACILIPYTPFYRDRSEKRVLSEALVSQESRYDIFLFQRKSCSCK